MEKYTHLTTYHPSGESSSVDFLKNCDFIDYHSVQSGHSFGGFSSEKYIKKTISCEKKPCIDAECFYEDFPIGFCLDWQYRLTDADIRKRLYHNLLAGAAGHTYGHQSVWRLTEKADGEYIYNWKEALDRPMANQMKYINRLIAKVDILKMKPYDISMNTPSLSSEESAMIYIQVGGLAFVDSGKIFKNPRACFFNPETGKFTENIFISPDKQVFNNPFEVDCILLIRNY